MAKVLNRKVQIYINDGEVKNTIKSIRDEVIRLEREQRRLPIGSEEYIKATKKIAELKGILRAQQVAVNDLGKTWESTLFKMTEFSNILMGIQSAFQMVDLGIGKIKDLAKDAAALDDAFGQVMKTTGLTHDEVEALNEEFKKMDTRTSREQLNQLAYEAGKLGITGVESVKQFVSASDKINIALGDVLGEGAMVTIGKMADVYSKSTEQLAAASGNLEQQMLSIGSAVNELGKVSTANEHYLVDFTARMGGVATQAGMSADQVLGFGSALDQSMQKVEMSATAFQKFIGQVMKKPAEFAEQAKMSVADFSELIRTDLNTALLRVLEGFQGQGGYAELVNIFKDLGLDGARAATVISSMANNIDKIREAQAVANRELSTGTSVLAEVEVMNNTMQAQAEKARKRFEEVRIELGNELYPVLIKLQKSGTALMKGVAGYIQLVKENKVVLIGSIALLANWVRMMVASKLATANFGGTIKSLIGVEKVKAYWTAIQNAREKARQAELAKSRIAVIQQRLEQTKQIATDKSYCYTLDGLTLRTKAQTDSVKLQRIATLQSTLADQAHTRAIDAKKAAFASTPWGLVITALTAIAGLTVKLVKNTDRWKMHQTMKEVSKQTFEAQGRLNVLYERLKNATAGSIEYQKALDELRQEYPELIAQHVNEEGRLRDLESAYKDLSAAARQSVYDRMYADKVTELQGELGEELQNSIKDSNKFIDRYLKNLSEAERQSVKQQANTILSQIAAGTKGYSAAYKEYTDLMHQYGNKNTQFGRLGWISDLYNESEKTKKSLNELKVALSPSESDPFGLEKKNLKQLNDMLATSQRLLKSYDKAADEGREGFAAKAETERKKIEAITAAISRLKKSESSAAGGSGSGSIGSGKETAEEKKARLAQEAWERFEGNYNRLMDRMGNKSKDGAAKVVADIDASIQKMRDDLTAVMGKHPEAKQMLEELNANAVAWKNAQLDEYIKKMNTALDKQRAKLKESDTEGNEYLNKVRDAQQKLVETFATYDSAVAQAQVDIAALQEMMATASDEEKNNLQGQIDKLNELIKQYGVLKGQMQARVFDAIDTSSVGASRLSGDESQWRGSVQSSVAGKKSSAYSMLFSQSDFDAYGKALESIWQKYEKQKKSIAEARAANEAMLTELQQKAAADPENAELKEKIRLRTEEKQRLDEEAAALDGLRDSALEAAEQDAFGSAIEKWISGIETFGHQMTELWGNINKILDNIGQKELNDMKRQHDAATKELDEQLEEGLISQEEYDAEKERMQTEYDEKEKAFQLEQWKRQKALNIGTATMEGALAVLKALSSAPPPYNAVLAGIAAALAAVQIAAVASEPAPYAKGGYVERDTVYRAGEAGSEWVASHKLLADSRTAPVISALEAYQRGNSRALTDIPMAAINMAAATSASESIGRRQAAASILAPATDSREMVALMRDLNNYMKDPRNRQAVISRRTMEDFDSQENFLRNRAKLS